jgi:hypothetical protein
MWVIDFSTGCLLTVTMHQVLLAAAVSRQRAEVMGWTWAGRAAQPVVLDQVQTWSALKTQTISEGHCLKLRPLFVLDLVLIGATCSIPALHWASITSTLNRTNLSTREPNQHVQLLPSPKSLRAGINYKCKLKYTNAKFIETQQQRTNSRQTVIIIQHIPLYCTCTLCVPFLQRWSRGKLTG